MRDDDKTITDWMDEFGLLEGQIKECIKRIRFSLGEIRFNRWVKKERGRLVDKLTNDILNAFRPKDGLMGSISGVWGPLENPEKIAMRFRTKNKQTK